MTRTRHTCVSLMAMAFTILLVLTATRNPALALESSALGAREVVNPLKDADGFSAVLYDNRNGLPTSEANDIAETSDGFVWIGSYSGLIRYDGNNFERIDSTTGIASVVSLYVDSKDRLWVGTNDSGLAIMERGEFRFYTKADGLDSYSVRDICEDAQGNVLVATTKGVAMINSHMELSVIDDERVAGTYVSVLRTGKNGVTYGVTLDGAVFTIRDGKVDAFLDAEGLGIEDVISVLPDPANPTSVYVGTAQSMVYHGKLGDLKNSQTWDVSPLTSIKDLEFLGDSLWVCADNGIGAIDGDRVKMLEDVPLNNSIDHAMTDYQGNLWFTSSRQGVMKVVPNQFLDLFDRYGLSSAVVNTTCRYEGLLLLGSDSGLIAVDDAGKQTRLPLDEVRTASGKRLDHTELVKMLDGIRIRSIVRDLEGRVWFSTYGQFGLVRLDHKTATCFTVDDGMPSDRMRTVIQRSDGTMAVACTGGVVLLEDDKVKTVYNEDDGIENTEILTVVEAANGDLIAGSDGNGIYVIGQGGTKHIGIENGLASEVVMRIKHAVSRDVLWIVTSNSLAYMDADYAVTTIHGFPYPNNFDLYENSIGEIWVLSSNGIYVTPAKDLIANKSVRPVFYGAENGLPCIATANSYSELAEDGNLYIAGTTGVARVNIETPFESIDDVKMAVPFVEADGVTLYPNGKEGFVVPANTQRLTIHPFVFTYSLLNPQVSYTIDRLGQIGSTVRASDLLPVDYTNLDGGTYHFSMRLQDALGHGNKDLVVTIKKELALTEQLWFRALSAGVALCGIWGATQLTIRARTRRLLKKQEEDRQYIREMSESFARVIDMKDAYTSGHSSRVAKYTQMLTRELGYDDDTVERYYNIALLHDIGKIGIPEEVLNKPGRLDDDEYEVIKSHTVLGHDALAGISIMPEIAVGAWAHHERPDGRGYPQGLKEGEIPRVAQIIAVADAFDAMYSDRPYRKRMNFKRVVSIIKEARGTQLTSDVVDAFLRLVEKGELRHPNDHGGGSTEDINNIRTGHASEDEKE